MLIRINVKDSRTRGEHEHAFRQFPIRIGRNALNDLVIDDGFVSQWHGIIRHDGRHLTFMDLGSTNGSSLNGKRLPKDVAVPLPAGAHLNVACFQLAFLVAPVEQDQDSVTQIVVRRPNLHTVAQPAGLSDRTACVDFAPFVRCLRLLQGFSDAFVALRMGHQEFGEQVGVRPIAGTTLLHRARSGSQVAEHLLDSSRSVEVCLAELKSIFADMGIHQIALMEGISQSVRSLLESLDPVARPGLAARLWGRRTDEGLRLATLIDEDEALHAEIFGEAFARAYASVALGAGQE